MRAWELALACDAAESAVTELSATERQAAAAERPFNRLLAQALCDVDDASFVRGVLTGLEDGQGSRVWRRVQQALPERRPQSRRRSSSATRRWSRPTVFIAVPLAAALLLTAWLFSSSAQVDSRWLPADQLVALPADRLVAVEEAALVLHDDAGGRIRLLPGARFRPLAADAAVAGELLAGRLLSRWQERAEAAVIQAGPLRCRVLGTAYSLERDADGGVRCLVTEGQVGVASASAAFAPLSPGDALSWPAGAAEPERFRLPDLLAYFDGPAGLRPRYSTPALRLQLPPDAADPAGLAVDWRAPITIQSDAAAAGAVIPGGMTLRWLVRPQRSVQGILPMALFYPRGIAGPHLVLTLMQARPGRVIDAVIQLDGDTASFVVDGVMQRREELPADLQPTDAWALVLCGAAADWERPEPPPAYRLLSLSLHAGVLDEAALQRLPDRPFR